MEKPGLNDWINALRDNNIIDDTKADKFLKENNDKIQALEDEGLPVLKDYGFFDSVADIKSTIHPKEADMFIARCVAKDGSGLKRAVGVTFADAIDFIESLPGGTGQWSIQIKEFVQTVVSGTIIVSDSGHTQIETWHGPHYNNDTSINRVLATYNPLESVSFKWDQVGDIDDLDEVKEFAMRALRYIFPHLRPKPGHKVYLEYGIKQDGSIFFIDVSHSDMLIPS